MPELKKGDYRRRGAAGERLVEADLLFRDLEVTVPSVDLGDDIHVKLAGKWVSVQVKTQAQQPTRINHHGKRFYKGGMEPNRTVPINSEVIAWVNADTLEITYDPPLPDEDRFVDELLNALRSDP